jgi:hypothetical protein
MRHPGSQQKRYAGTVINDRSAGVSAPISIHSGMRSGFDYSGVRSPTMSHISMTSSTMNQESKAIYQERLYQLQNAMQRLIEAQSPNGDSQGYGSCKEFENIVNQIKNISFSAESLSTMNSRSLKIWAKVVLDAPLIDLLTNH